MLFRANSLMAKQKQTNKNLLIQRFFTGLLP